MKQAAAAWRSGRKATRATKRAAPKRRRTPVRRRSTGGRKKVGKKRGLLNPQSLMKYIRLAALASPVIKGVAQHGMTKGAAIVALKGFTGINVESGRFDINNLVEGWTPYLAAVLATYGIPKIAGLIRGI